MQEPTREEADWAFAQLEYFRDYVFDGEPEDLPTVDDVAFCVATLILWHRLDRSVPKISKLMRLLDRNGVSYRQLSDLLEPFYLYVFDLREREIERLKQEIRDSNTDSTDNDVPF